MRARELRPESDDWDELQRVIETKCAACLPVVPMYRGTNGMPNNFLGTIRTDRKARDSDDDEVRIFNLYMQANGLPHRKSNTLSVTLQASQASIFGRDLYQIYPFDGSYYVGSSKFSDFKGIPRTISKVLYQFGTFSWGEFAEAMKEDSYVLGLMTQHKHELQEALGMWASKDPSHLHNSSGEIIIYGDPPAYYVALRV